MIAVRLPIPDEIAAAVPLPTPAQGGEKRCAYPISSEPSLTPSNRNVDK
jgi:hypothetical protein